MSRMRVTAAQILADCPLVVGFGGWGVLGSELPATGEHGPSVGYQWIDPIADANKEIWVRITTEPSAGTLLMWPDSSFEYDGPSTTFEAQLAVDAADVGTPQTVTVTVGAGGAGALAAQEAGSDAAAIAGAVLVAGALSVTESGADAFASSGAVKIAGSLSAAEQGADTAIIVGGNILAGYLAAQESGSDTAAASGAVVVSGALAASEAGADGFAASGSVGSANIIGSFAALESGADTISVSGVVLVAGVLAAAEAGSDTMQTDTGEGYPSSVTITVPAGRLMSAASGRTITLRPR